MCQNIITHSNINPTRQLNKCGLNLNNSGIYVLVGNFKAFLQILTHKNTRSM